MLPNFFCIGAQKSGTTTVWHLLNAHPNICMAQPRETRFFYDDFLYQDGIQRYEINYFNHWNGEMAVGEKCPEYLYVDQVASRIYNSIGSDPKFIVTLRSPAQRAFSHYRHNLNALRECRSFEEVIAGEAEKKERGESIDLSMTYLSRGLYAQQLTNYLKYFKLEQFLCLDFEHEILGDQRGLALKLYHFLGLKPMIPKGLPYKAGHPKLEELSLKYLDRENKVKVSRVGASKKQKLFSLSKAKDEVTYINHPSEEFKAFVEAFNKNRPMHSRLPKEREQQMNELYFKDDIQQLSDMLDHDFSHWLA